MQPMAAVIMAALILSSAAFSQASSTLVGTWRLVSATTRTDTGEVTDTFGSEPKGFLTYTADGRMAVVITSSGRKPLSVNDPRAAPVVERAEAFSTMVAYAGRYTLEGNKLIHHVEASWMPNQAGTDLTRLATLQGDRIILKTTPMLLNGARSVVELTWERLR